MCSDMRGYLFTGAITIAFPLIWWLRTWSKKQTLGRQWGHQAASGTIPVER
jgi:hypothetical protein